MQGAAAVAGGAIAGAMTGAVAARSADGPSPPAAPGAASPTGGASTPATSEPGASGSESGGPEPGGPWRFVAPGASIQAAIDDGATSIQLGAGTYPVTEPIRPSRGCAIRGVGPTTMVVAEPEGDADLPAVISVGGGGEVDGVSISALFVSCAQRATTGIDVHIVGSTDNVFGEPDAVCRLDDLRIWSATENGVWYRGTDAQAIVTSRVRVRQAGRYGFRIEAPDNVWIACEATTRKDPPPGDVPAGFFIGSANGHFSHCKAWYVRGYGWQVAGVRNVLTGCEAQDCGDHGFFVDQGKNTLTGCMADTASALVAGGTADGADGFFVRPESPDVVLSGCIAFDRTAEPQQRYGFNVPAGMVAEGRFAANAAWDNRSGDVNRR